MTAMVEGSVMLEVFVNAKGTGLETIAAREFASMDLLLLILHWEISMVTTILEQTFKSVLHIATPPLANNTILTTVWPVKTTPMTGMKPISTANAPTKESVIEVLDHASASQDLREKVVNVCRAQMTAVERDNVSFSEMKMVTTPLGMLIKPSDANVILVTPVPTARSGNAQWELTQLRMFTLILAVSTVSRGQHMQVPFMMVLALKVLMDQSTGQSL